MVVLNCPLDLCTHCSKEMDGKPFMHKGLFWAVCKQFYLAGLNIKAVSVSGLCGHKMAPRNGSFVRYQSHTGGMLTTCFIRQGEGSALSHKGTMFAFHISP